MTNKFLYACMKLLLPCATMLKKFPYIVGGYGTMEEVMEMTTWSQLGIHDKPVSVHLLQGMLLIFHKSNGEDFVCLCRLAY